MKLKDYIADGAVGLDLKDHLAYEACPLLSSLLQGEEIVLFLKSKIFCGYHSPKKGGPMIWHVMGDFPPTLPAIPFDNPWPAAGSSADLEEHYVFL